MHTCTHTDTHQHTHTHTHTHKHTHIQTHTHTHTERTIPHHTQHTLTQTHTDTHIYTHTHTHTHTQTHTHTHTESRVLLQSDGGYPNASGFTLFTLATTGRFVFTSPVRAVTIVRRFDDCATLHPTGISRF